MRIRKAAKWVVLFVVLAMAGTAGLLYVLAAQVPPDYQPARLTQQQKRQVAYDFVNEKLIRELNNPAQEGRPFDWRVTEGEINRYIASADEIAWLGLGSESPQAHERLEQAGLSEPAVSLADGTLTLMARDMRRNKIVSITFAAEKSDGRLRLRLAGARVGRVAVPRSIVADRVERFRTELAESLPTGDDAGGAVERFGVLMAGLLVGDGEDVEPIFTAGINNRRVRVTDVTITDETITLHLEPVQ
ncbi:MAG: hypothetical protein ACP5HU_11050 [Phycisphaerae bacterium]